MDRGQGRLCGRWIGALTSIALFLVSLNGAVAQASSLPPEGIFDNCSLDTQMPTCINRLQVMHDGGMKVVVMTAGGASIPSLATYADAAHRLGMSVMWELSNPGWWQSPASATDMSGPFAAFATGCGCRQNGQILTFMVHWLGLLPGTYGYYAADDSMIGPADRAGIAAFVNRVKQADGAHTVMIGAADNDQGAQYQSIPDVIGQEIYPVTTDSLLPIGDNQGMWDSVAYTAADAQRSATRAGKQSAFILQAFTFGDNVDDGSAVGVCSMSESKLGCYQKLRYPSAAEQLQLRNEILKHAHPKLILWWSFQGTYGQAGNDTYSIYPTGAVAAARWRGLSAAVRAPLATQLKATTARARTASKRRPSRSRRAHIALQRRRGAHWVSIHPRTSSAPRHRTRR